MTASRLATLLVIMILAACDLRGKTEASSLYPPAPGSPLQPAAASVSDSSVVAAPVADSAVTDSPLADTPVWAAPAAADTASAATALELAQLAQSLVVPVQGVARSQLRDSYTEARTGHVHEAMDILAPRGTPVVSATDGRLLKLFTSKQGGLMVYATDSSERFILLYGHLDSYAAGLANGMSLKRGQTIGYVGTTGNAPVETPHLHFGILRANPSVSWWVGVPVNPYLLYVPA